ncbi:ergothioneine biosynthesis protein EgtB [Brevundimonas sp. SORGH_AS_0993]|uniref:ergothioneine biosynthesis protein EgtB n=1 Tax=Brevundimonas sp. SORGH_AS_0993 TaxID=3041794 RepID=UPI002784A49A|nr:ergothioneine biosynthesis protein EgtB [Brevundimonas sp. SORGH_AS_0993]MDQ1153275.1 dimethylhistidine N-methyltransferase [Brevundimonas sp. SORGH_AS_0993]
MARDGLPDTHAHERAQSSDRLDIDRFRQIRSAMPQLAQGLSPEDLSAQSMPDCSPGKWHLAHTSWFFEAMILAAEPGYQPVDPRFQRLFNSYYEALGDRVARHQRGLMTRPSLSEVMAYRREVDRRLVEWLARGKGDVRLRYLFELGLHHDQQHQELFLMDLLNLMACSPLDPAAYAGEPHGAVRQRPRGGMATFDGGLTRIGHDGPDFAFDNEGPAHRVWLEPFALAADLTTNGEWIAFIEDDGYARPELWLSDGWAVVKAEGWTAPLYWRRGDDCWTTLSLTGRIPVDPAAPVRHVSFYEADAFARWAGKRLPTEAEWEQAARTRPDAFSHLTGEVWQWTSSAYAPYPGFQPTPGTAAEYNGKFMANQMVLRGGSFATPEGHTRVTYRNFFYPGQRWAFAGVRLAADAPNDRRAASEDDQTAAFQQDLIEGLSRPQKAVPPKWLYDAEGSRLFEDITTLQEYYPTRQETALLRAQAMVLTAEFGPDAVLVEFGSGASEKTRLLLDAAPDLGAYVPLDISETALSEAAGRLRSAYPTLRVEPILGDFETLAPLPDDLPKGRRIGFFPGSTIGNLEPEEAVRFLASARTLLGEGALFILGVDLVKTPEVLVAAYDDAQSVTAAFNRNLLVRANAELDADFDLNAFRHRAIWNAEQSRMEMHLEAVCPTAAQIDGRRFDFAKGETIHTESSRKFTQTSVTDMAQAAGWRIVRFDASPAPSFALVLMSA